MYIEPFWCGVLVAILAEVGFILIGTAWTAWKERKNRRGQDNETGEKVD